MPWITHFTNASLLVAADLNGIIDALSTALGAHNGNGQVDSGWLSMTIIPTADLDALMLYPPALTGVGTQNGGRLVLRAHSWDTADHQRDFIWRTITTTNAGLGSLALLTRLDGGALSELLRITSAGNVGINCNPLSLFQVHVGTDENLAIYNFSGIVGLQSYNDAAAVFKPMGFNAQYFLFGTGPVNLSAIAAPGTPAAGSFSLYMDTADSKLKAKGPSGTVTILALP